MSALLFIVGYVIAATCGVHTLAATDPEPLGASVSLSLFAAAGFFVSLFTYTASLTSFSRSPRSLASFCTGAASAIALFAGLALTRYLGGGMAASLGAAAFSLIAIAALSPLCSRAA